MQNRPFSLFDSQCSLNDGPREAEPAEGWAEMIALGHRGMAGSRPDPVRAAVVFIGQHGDRAEARAVKIATEWMSEGNESAASWLVDVCDAIHELGRTERRPEESIH